MKVSFKAKKFKDGLSSLMQDLGKYSNLNQIKLI
jgi:hypothetical protein